MILFTLDTITGNWHRNWRIGIIVPGIVGDSVNKIALRSFLVVTSLFFVLTKNHREVYSMF